MRLAAAPLALVLAVVAVAGCGGSGAGMTSGSDHPDLSARELQEAWEQSPGCRRPDGASRWGCSVGAYRCQGVVSDRGWSIDCAKPGRSVGFTVHRRG